MKLGLIAMSGVRAANPDLTEIGLTLPGFVERSQVIASLPSLSLLTLAALTPPDIEVEYREIKDLRETPELPRDYDLVAIASYSAQILDAYHVAEVYRARGVPVVMGGLHVSVRPDEARAHGAVAVVGEGEVSWPRVIEDFRRGRLQDGGVDDRRAVGRDRHALQKVARRDLPDHPRLGVEQRDPAVQPLRVARAQHDPPPVGQPG